MGQTAPSLFASARAMELRDLPEFQLSQKRQSKLLGRRSGPAEGDLADVTSVFRAMLRKRQRLE